MTSHIVAKASQAYGKTSSGLVPRNDSHRSVISIATICIGTGPGGTVDRIAQVVVIDHRGGELFNEMVLPDPAVPITDYRTTSTGFTDLSFVGAKSLDYIQREVTRITHQKTIVGYKLFKCAKDLRIPFTASATRDIALYAPLMNVFLSRDHAQILQTNLHMTESWIPPLSGIVLQYMRRTIRGPNTGYVQNAIENTRASLDVYLSLATEWENSVSSQHRVDNPVRKDRIVDPISSTTTPLIAQDVIDSIIDSLFDDISALRMCSLTSHRFLYRSQSHLFRRVRFSPEGPFPDQFLPIMRSTPNLALFVRELILVGSAVGKKNQWISSNPALPLILESLDNLNSVSISCVDGACFLSGGFEVYTLFLSKPITTLALSVIFFEITDHFFNLLEQFPSLQNITLDRVFCRGNISAPARRVSRDIVLKDLNITLYTESSGSGIEMITADSSPLRLDHLTSISVLSSSMSDLLQLNTVLDTSHDFIERLNFGSVSSLWDQRVFDSSQLRWHHIPYMSLVITDPACHQLTLGSWAHALRFDGRQFALKHLVLAAELFLSPGFPVSGHTVCDRTQWEAMDNALSHMGMQNLRRVDIILQPVEVNFAIRECIMEIRGVIETACSSLRERNILFFDIPPHEYK
ncbi:uncharacterized protein EV420DRAFT_1647918 [Desarmillaria tabescens]|uniref:Exonuclease domain-containing protein n=1 Tax=Armillaria tabescens TaxID=1929756 RepID=A0AA39JQF3_ARMTA|nr:uncharacterized protein EV420DRAFT_1647918 [Desarmillaria tabescens]KAK0447022.1 hypothetical protein EV420DRAFT_1647918 [Desarmillaria tabescens]